MTSCKVTGLGDALLEGVLSIALEETIKETGKLDDEILGLVISAVKLANKVPRKRKPTARLLHNVSRALVATGWAR